jgi:hypothetical protein
VPYEDENTWDAPATAVRDDAAPVPTIATSTVSIQTDDAIQ